MAFEALWAAAAAKMDEAVDGILGDRILYQRVGESGFTELPGFVVFRNEALDLGEIDETQGTVTRVKIARSALPTITLRDRLRHPKLGSSTYRPLGALPETDGRYWIFDVQEVTS